MKWSNSHIAAWQRFPLFSIPSLKLWGKGMTKMGSGGLKFVDFICTSIRLAHFAILPDMRPEKFCDCISRRQVLKFCALVKWAFTRRRILAPLAPLLWRSTLHSSELYFLKPNFFRTMQKSSRLPSSSRFLSSRLAQMCMMNPGSSRRWRWRCHLFFLLSSVYTWVVELCVFHKIKFSISPDHFSDRSRKC